MLNLLIFLFLCHLDLPHSEIGQHMSTTVPDPDLSGQLFYIKKRTGNGSHQFFILTCYFCGDLLDYCRIDYYPKLQPTLRLDPTDQQYWQICSELFPIIRYLESQKFSYVLELNKEDAERREPYKFLFNKFGTCTKNITDTICRNQLFLLFEKHH
jgi:hypothetical protein